MGSVSGIPSTRVSDAFIRRQLANQVLTNQIDLLRVEAQLSTGRRIHTPSEDTNSALRIISLQRALERKAQAQANLVTNQSYLTASDTVLSTLSESLADARSVALGAIGAYSSDEQRQGAAIEVKETLQRVLDVGNKDFRGRYLFAGSLTSIAPFEPTGKNLISYMGNENRLASYADLNALFDTNLHGSEIFGAISEPAQGTVDLDPILTFHTRLTDLYGGSGIDQGEIGISDGSNFATIDLSSAETIGDVAAMILDGSGDIALDVEITSTGLKLISASGRLLTVREVGGKTTAEDLGILTTMPVATIDGSDLDPVLRPTTQLDDILGTRSYCKVFSVGSDNNIHFEAPTVGTAYNDIKIVFDDDGSVIVPGNDETASYDPATRTLTVTVKAGQTLARHVVDAVEEAYALGNVPITARLDSLDDVGNGFVDATPPGELAGMTAGGSGTAFDKDSGLQIVNGGTTHVVSFADAQTVEDVLNILNTSQIGVLAEINSRGTGIDIRSRISGADFMIGENGGTTATELGLRTFNTQTRLDELNYNRGVSCQPGTDFTITRSDGVQVDIDVSDLGTVGEVLDRINTLGGGMLEARLAAYGNGIELFDYSAGGEPFVVSIAGSSMAAIGLGLIAKGQISSESGIGAATATATVAFPGANNDLVFRAIAPGTELNDVEIIFQDTATESVDYDPVGRTLTFDIIAGVTNANQIISLLEADPTAGALFVAELDADDGTPNDGFGFVADGVSATMTGGSQVLTGTDVNPLETKGVFTALSRLHAALQVSDLSEIQRAIEILDDCLLDLNVTRAELGARQQRLDIMQDRLEAENIDLQAVLSEEYDADLAQVVSEYATRQAAYEASLQASAGVLQMSLLDYL